MRYAHKQSRQSGNTVTVVIIALIIVLLAIGLHIWLGYGNPGIGHDPPPTGNNVPKGVITNGTWSQTETNVKVFNRYTFIYTLEKSNPTSPSGFVKMPKTNVAFAIAPSPHVRIISVNKHMLMSNAALTATDGNGQVSVVFEVLSQPSPPEGSLGAIPQPGGTLVEAKFEITKR
ncbi:MAG: hypothetical protein WBC05_16985 [Sedimentisphaerales bacterium]